MKSGRNGKINYIAGWKKTYLLSVDGFVFNSQATRLSVETLVGSQLPGVIAYPCGNRLNSQITEKEISARSVQAGPLRVVFLGNLISRKALHVLLAALHGLPSPNYYLTVIGDLNIDKAYTRSIREQILNNRMDKRVVLLGSVSDDELTARLKESHVLVVPSSYEGFGIAYLEGMGFGLPAIGTTAGGAREVITHGRDGYLITTGDSSTLSRYLLELNHDRNKLETMSLASWRRF